MSYRLTRRQLLAAAGSAGAATALSPVAWSQPEEREWKLCLNTSTIRPAGLTEKVDIVAQAGYQGIELWSNDLAKHVEEGGSLEDLAKRIADLGLEVPNVIGLWGWLPEDREALPQALERARPRIEQAAEAGSKHIAAVPTPDREDLDLMWAAECYGRLMEVGDEFGITVAVEFVGFVKGVNRLGKAALIAMESGRRDACIVADTFHMYRGGSDFEGVKLLNGEALAVFHWNDAPAEPPREEQRDQHRVYPGDGILPLVQLLRDLRDIGFHGPLSLELFNRDYWQQPLLEVARTGIRKMRELIAASEA
ncbi:MAG: sugar phosphate isomerase/epimerase family protein [Armatimonadota bacterium]